MKPWLRLLVGMVLGALAGAVLWRGGVWLWDDIPELGYPSLLLVPFLSGFVASWVWAPLEMTRGGHLVFSLVFTVVLLLGAWVAMGEGVVCLVIASPLLFLAVAGGSLMARELFAKKEGKMFMVSCPILVFLALVEPMALPPQKGVVVDRLRIAASPTRVWPNVLAFDTIPDPPNYWLFHLGLPYPQATTNSGHFVGAARACQFSGGATFEEKIAEFEPSKLLTFDIVKSPPDPELLGHLDAHRGQFELVDNGDGSTTLIGRTWYTLRMRPAWYFDFWTHSIFRAVHLRVMRDVQRRSEPAR